MDTAKKVWTYLLRAGLTPEGAAGLMGNIFAESGMIPERVEILCLKRLKELGKIYTDATYTAFVDDGTITRSQFLHPLPGKQYGYGLCQWTSPERKGGLYDLARKNRTSIGDVETQLEWLLSELTISYKEVLRILKSTKNVLTASNAVLTRFEMPADTGAAVRQTRYEYSMKYYDQFKENTMAKTRTAIVDLAKSWIGKMESDGSHQMIIDIYNAHRPLARGYAVRYTDAWCATFVSALAIKLGYTDIIPLECGCPEMIELAKKKGIWVESDTYTPQPGDIIMYDWQDSGTGDNRGTADHVGIVTMVSGSLFEVIEGNKNNAVGTRTMAVNGKDIRGYICPKYDAETETARDRLVAACRKMDAEMIKSQQAGAKWGYYNSNTSATFEKALSTKNYRANCATTANWALKMIGAIPEDVTGFYGEKGGEIHWKSAKVKEAVLKVADVIPIGSKKTVSEALKDGTIVAGDIVTYVDIQHTNTYLGGGKWLDSGHAYADGSGDGAGWKTWIGGTYYGAQPIGTIIRLKEEKKTDSKVNPICGTCSVTLKQFLIGASDPQVKIIQLKLNYLGYKGKNGLPLVVDGELGQNTAYAIEQLQRKAGLPDSTNWGTVGAKTWALILG